MKNNSTFQFNLNLSISKLIYITFLSSIIQFWTLCGVAHADEATAKLCNKLDDNKSDIYKDLTQHGYYKDSQYEKFHRNCKNFVGKRITEESSATTVYDNGTDISACFGLACAASKTTNNCLTLTTDIMSLERVKGNLKRWGCP